MKINKVEYFNEENNVTLLINGEKYGYGITKLEITGDGFKVYTPKREKSADYGEIGDMHLVNELKKYENIIIVEE